MISILIPLYNFPVVPLVEELLKQAISTSITFEIIIINDASIVFNEENEILTQFEKVGYIKHNENQGRTKIRQQLAQQARYDWLLFLDADVIPAEGGFLKKYDESLKKNIPIVAGGVIYHRNKPEKEKALRYKYGIWREEKTTEQRNKENHIVVSANLLIKKEVFQKINTVTHNFYGDDLLLSSNIMKLDIKVLHIDNPVIHLGLESNQVFLEKSLAAVESLVALENSKDLLDNLTKIQKTYKFLKKNALHTFIHPLLGIFKNSMRRNLLSKNPSLFLFDLYRLYHYISIKR
ncbi:MAG: glycosyltransferase family 2 protein [Flavobacteriaceae bacterium]|nr:glycosyltransferase family 2 protein [Flavobacteriaceae bacterium]